LGNARSKAWHFVELKVTLSLDVVCESIKPLKNQTPTPCKWPLKPINKGRHREIISKGITVFFCNANGIKDGLPCARQCRSFYLNWGSEIYDEPFVEVGIPHEHMRIQGRIKVIIIYDYRNFDPIFFITVRWVLD
jgi:hypothetical protein